MSESYGNFVDGAARQWMTENWIDQSKHLAKVRVVGSNPVFRSKEVPGGREGPRQPGGRKPPRQSADRPGTPGRVRPTGTDGPDTADRGRAPTTTPGTAAPGRTPPEKRGGHDARKRGSGAWCWVEEMGRGALGGVLGQRLRFPKQDLVPVLRPGETFIADNCFSRDLIGKVTPRATERHRIAGRGQMNGPRSSVQPWW